MSISHLMEVLGGRVAVAYGQLMDGTPLARDAYKVCMGVAQNDFEFLQKSGAAMGDTDLSKLDSDESRIQAMANALKIRGFKQQYGEEIFFNGITGQRMGSQGCNERGAGLIFVGPIAMYKLAHLGPDKLHSRSTGLRHILTRQPVEGIKNNGGYRTGQMELWCLMGHGAAYLLRELNFLVSDPFVTHICLKCGYVCEPNMKDHFYYCKVCKSNENTCQVPIAYSFILLFKHCHAAGILPRYRGRKIR